MEDLGLERLEVDISSGSLAFVGGNRWEECLLRDWRMKSSIFMTGELMVDRERKFAIRIADRNADKQ